MTISPVVSSIESVGCLACEALAPMKTGVTGLELVGVMTETSLAEGCILLCFHFAEEWEELSSAFSKLSVSLGSGVAVSSLDDSMSGFSKISDVSAVSVTPLIQISTSVKYLLSAASSMHACEKVLRGLPVFRRLYS